MVSALVLLLLEAFRSVVRRILREDLHLSSYGCCGQKERDPESHGEMGKKHLTEAQEKELDHEVMIRSMSKRTEAEIKLQMDRDPMEQDRGPEGSEGERVKRKLQKGRHCFSIKSHLQDTSLEAKSTDPGTVRNMAKDKTR